MSTTPQLGRQANPQPRTRGVANLRWYICGLLFWATTVNYVDRQVLGILKPVLQHELHWNETDYGDIVFAFQLAYAIMMPVAGKIVDWLGTRLGYALAVVIWSFASMAHSFAYSLGGFFAARFALGLGEAGNFPSAIKTVAEWFPKKERALATGIFNSGTNVGAVVAPLLVPFVAALMGWRAVFFVTGGLDLIWVVVWLSFYRNPSEHKLLTWRELALIEQNRASDAPKEKIPYRNPQAARGLSAFIIGKFLTDPVWWFYLFWIPGFLASKFGLSLTKLGPPLIVIYVAADVGSVLGGWIAGRFIKLGWPVSRARKTAMLVFAISVLAVIPVQFTGHNLWLTVTLIGIATGSHQGWSANIFTMASDIFPRSMVGAVVGWGGMGGAIGGMLIAEIVGRWLDFSHGKYGPLFIAAGSAYLIALLIIQLLVPRYTQLGSESLGA